MCEAAPARGQAYRPSADGLNVPCCQRRLACPSRCSATRPAACRMSLPPCTSRGRSQSRPPKCSKSGGASARVRASRPRQRRERHDGCRTEPWPRRGTCRPGGTCVHCGIPRRRDLGLTSPPDPSCMPAMRPRPRCLRPAGARPPAWLAAMRTSRLALLSPLPASPPSRPAGRARMPDNSLYIRRPPRRAVNSLGGGVSQADRPAVMRLDRALRQHAVPSGAGAGPARRRRRRRG